LDYKLPNKQKKTEQKQLLNPLAWGVILPDRPRPIRRVLDGLEDACYAVRDFFSGVLGHVSLIYNILRYPDFIRNALSGTFPTPQPPKKKENKTENRQQETDQS
jgi:hypothetical protein